MKTFMLSVLTLALASLTSVAQIRVPQKVTRQTTQDATIQQTQSVPIRQKTIPGVEPASAPNHTISVNMGDGKKMKVELVRNIRDWANEGDRYKTTVYASSASSNTNGGWNCNTKTVSVTAESVTFMPAMENLTTITAGSIYTFDDFYTGAYNEITAGRNPITIYTTNIRTSGPVTRQVINPMGSTITQAIRDIVMPFSTEAGSARLIYRTFSSNSDLDFKLKVTAGGMYGAFKASANYDLNTNEKKIYLTFDVSKPMFKVIAERPVNGFFSNPAVEQQNPNMIYVKEVEYGTRVLVNLEITVNNREDIAKITASYGVGDTTKKEFSASMDLIRTLKGTTTTVNAYITGAPQDVTTLNKDKLEEEIRALVQRCNYGTAEPIMYKLADMNGRVIGVRSTTDQFQIRDCTPASSVFQLKRATAVITSGTDSKEYPSQFIVQLTKKRSESPTDKDLILFNSPQEESIAEIKPGEASMVSLKKNP
ncbi:MAG: hypothetical protein E4G92_02505 [Bacteroidia bacterium]|nr:MAG: hypothetical protein E4G92_02505 [Bacteroidia bacterium]